MIAGARTASGFPLLANDPHLTFRAPSIWNLVHLESPEGSVVGASLPGVPAIVIGRNEHLAWGITNSGVDVQDLYAMEGNATHYKHSSSPTGWLPYRFRRETIQIKRGRPREVAVRESIYGPVVTDTDATAKALLGDDLKAEYVAAPAAPLSLRWVSLERNDTTVMAIFAMNKAKTWEEFRDAQRLFVAPSSNVVFAARDGTIAYTMNGKVPIRSRGHTGYMVVPGTGAYDWQGFIPPEHLPSVVNPERGWLVTANNRVVSDAAYGYPLGGWRDDVSGYRAKRLTELANGTAPVSAATMAAWQLDDTSLLLRDPRMQKILGSIRNLDERAEAFRRRMTDLDAAGGWDGAMAVGSETASVFQLFFRALSALAGPTLDLADRDAGEQAYFRSPQVVLDRVEAEGVDTFLETAFAEAVAEGSRKRWGRDLHTATFEHAPLHQAGPLACLADRSVPHGGSFYTPNAGGFSLGSEKLRNTYGPSYRQVVDFADLDGRSIFINPMGQSGCLGSKKYDNLLPLWAAGEYLPMSMARNASSEQLVLKPRA